MPFPGAANDLLVHGINGLNIVEKFPAKFRYSSNHRKVSIPHCGLKTPDFRTVETVWTREKERDHRPTNVGDVSLNGPKSAYMERGDWGKGVSRETSHCGYQTHI